MKTATIMLVLFFFISLLNEGAVDVGIVLKRNIMSTQTHKNTNLLIEEVDVAPSGPNPGGNNNTQSISQVFNYVHRNKLNIQFQKGGHGVSPCDTHNQKLSRVVDGDHPNLLIEEVDVALFGSNSRGNSNTQSISQGLNYVHHNKLNIQFQKGGVSPCDTHNQRISRVVDGDNPNLLIEEVDVSMSGSNLGGNNNTQSIYQGLNYVHHNKINKQFQKGGVSPCNTHSHRLSRVVDGHHEHT